MLTVTSLLSILLFTFHIADDSVRGFEQGGAMRGLAIVLAVIVMAMLVTARPAARPNPLAALRQE